MAADSPETNPYAPPRERKRKRKARRPKAPAPGESIKWIYGAVAFVQAVAFVALATGVAGAAGIARELVTLVDGPLYLTMIGLAFAWIYYAWSGIPYEHRRGTSPGSAVLQLFIPIYGLFWLFAVNVQLCNTIDRLLDQVGDRRRAPKALAIFATILQTVPTIMLATDAKQYTFVVAVVNAALWFAYMIQCDPLRRAVVSHRF